MVKIISDSTCDLSKEIVDRFLHGLMPTRQHQKLLHHQWKVLLKLLNHVLKKDMI